jgi:hypothetical protein
VPQALFGTLYDGIELMDRLSGFDNEVARLKSR